MMNLFEDIKAAAKEHTAAAVGLVVGTFLLTLILVSILAGPCG